MSEFKREEKYLVLKWDDISSMSEANQELLMEIIDLLQIRRRIDGKKQNTYVVVNEDEPYAEKVWELIKRETKRKEIESKLPDVVCPECGLKADEDWNSISCNNCQKTWPKR